MTKLRFEELDLSSEMQSAIKDMGFEEASPIQAASIPLILEGKDIIGQAQTGTGKTAAFAIPVIERLDPENKNIQAVVLCPTRELVIQVSEEFRKLMKYRENLYVVPVYGGQEIERQLRSLKKGAQVIIGTPGRTMDHMRRGSIKMDSVKFVVLDEADEMLDMGFRDDIEVILKDTSEDRQTIMFSATMAKEIQDLSRNYLNEPALVNVTHKKLDAPKIQQVYFEVVEKNKPEVLARLIDLHNIKLALVFCNTKSQVDQLVEVLKTRGYFADALHGDMNQNQRDKVMNGFRNGSVEILVATDVAGRGIDVNNVEAVFNYDLPRDDEDYIHRIGRTGRAGKTGIAFSFIVGKQIYNLMRIQRANGALILRQNIPTMEEIEATRINTFSAQIKEIIEKGHLGKYVSQVELLMGEDYTSLDVSAALLKMIMEKENEGFDKDANFELPREETKFVKKKFSVKRTDSRFEKKDNFRKPARKKEVEKDSHPFIAFGGKSKNAENEKRDDFKKKSRKSGSEKGANPFSFSEDITSEFLKEHAEFGGKRKKKSWANDSKEKYKSFKSSEKRKKSSDNDKFSRENKLKKDDAGSRTPKKKSSSFKEFGQGGGGKKPGRKFGKR